MLPQGSSFTTRPQLAGTFGMIASTHWLASAAGMAVLEEGGTAFDAAVAAGLVLQVVEPHMNGLGGEAPVIGYDASSGAGGVFVLDGQGPAPAAATVAAFGALGLDLVPGNGLLAACVPAAFGTWLLLLEQHGRLPLRSVMRYAIGYARDGYPMTAGVSAGIASAGRCSVSTGRLGRDLPGGRRARPWCSFRESSPGRDLPAHPGRRPRRPGPIRDAQIEAARRAFYEGFVAEAIAAYLAGAEVMDVTGQPHRALLAGAGPGGLAGPAGTAGDP